MQPLPPPNLHTPKVVTLILFMQLFMYSCDDKKPTIVFFSKKHHFFAKFFEPLKKVEANKSKMKHHP